MMQDNENYTREENLSIHMSDASDSTSEDGQQGKKFMLHKPRRIHKTSGDKRPRRHRRLLWTNQGVIER